MSRKPNGRFGEIGRREMLRWSAAATVTSGLGIPLASAEEKENAAAILAEKKPLWLPPVSGPGEIVKVHKPGMKAGFFPEPKAAREMVDKAVMELAGETDPGRAWLKFISPTDRVGIKVNCLGTRMVSTMREMTFAVADAIRDAGVPDANIVVIDMFASNMMGGRYDQQSNPNRMRVLAHRSDGKYQSWLDAGPARARFADIFLWTTAIINMPPIKDHDLAGVTCCMKNMTFGTVEKPHLNHDGINEKIPHLWATEEIRSRVRLNLIDGTSILYDGGPKYNRAALVPHECVYATTDPVAMDSLAHELIAALRKENGLRTLGEVGRPPKFLELSEQMGLGIADRKKHRVRSVDLAPLETKAQDEKRS